MNTRAFLFVFCFAISRADVEPELDQNLRSCMRKGMLNFEGSATCYPFGEEKPCEPMEKLFLDSPENMKPVCKRVCDDGFVHVPAQKSCLPKKRVEKRQCGSVAVLKDNLFGKITCVCPNRLVRFDTGDNGKEIRCEKLYSRSPCQEKHYIAFPPDEYEIAKCLPDPCHKMMTKEGGDFALYNGQCYELLTKGPCANVKEVLKVSPPNEPECYGSEDKIIASGQCHSASDGSCYNVNNHDLLKIYADRPRGPVRRPGKK